MSDETTKTTPELELEVFPALSDMLLKAEIVEHLVNVHGLTHVDSNSLTGDPARVKVSKERLLEVHESIHVQWDTATWRWVEKLRYDYATGTYMGAWVPTKDGRNLAGRGGVIVPHRHDTVEESAEMRAAAIAARTGGKISDQPLPAAQLRLLGEIVRQDFRIIEQEVREFAAEALEVKTKEIRDEFKAREGDAPKLKKKAETKIAKLMEELRQLREEANEVGITLSTPNLVPACNYEIKGLKDALTAAVDENKSALQRALAKLEREKAVALRRVQLAGISVEAVKLLDELPDARQMMIEASMTKPKELG